MIWPAVAWASMARPSEPILHVDLDAFYASVEVLKDPSLRGKPVIVGGTGSRGVVTSASYEARRSGVHSAMPSVRARRLCPEGIFLPPDFEAYRVHSNRFREVMLSFTPLVEPISLDEAFLDVTATEHLFGGAVAMAKEIKRAVRETCGLVVSVGVATNKLCAKVGSDLRKPDGLVIVPDGGEAAFLAPLPLERLWGVGPRTREVLAGWDLRTIGELAAFDRRVLESRLGEHGTDIWERANGIDDGEVQSGHVPKSVGHSHTFDENTLDPSKIESTLLGLSEGVGRRLRDHALRGRTITMTLRVAPFETRTRQRTLREPTDDDVTIFRIARQLLRDALAEDREGGRTSPVRLVGVSVSGVSEGQQLGLFDAARHTRLNAALDAVRARFGDGALDRASAREVKERRRFSGQRYR